MNKLLTNEECGWGKKLKLQFLTITVFKYCCCGRFVYCCEIILHICKSNFLFFLHNVEQHGNLKHFLMRKIVGLTLVLVFRDLTIICSFNQLLSLNNLNTFKR